MMPKKRTPEHTVETDEERKARKEHESAAAVAGLVATLDAGNVRDEQANIVPTVEAIDSILTLLTRVRDVAVVLEEEAQPDTATEEAVEEEVEDATEEAEPEATEEVVEEAEEESEEKPVEEMTIEELEEKLAKMKAKEE